MVIKTLDVLNAGIINRRVDCMKAYIIQLADKLEIYKEYRNASNRADELEATERITAEILDAEIMD